MRPLAKEEGDRKGEVLSLSYLCLKGRGEKNEDASLGTGGEKQQAKRRKKNLRLLGGAISAIKVVLEELTREIPNVIAAEVVCIDDGTPSSAISQDPSLTPK